MGIHFDDEYCTRSDDDDCAEDAEWLLEFFDSLAEKL